MLDRMRIGVRMQAFNQWLLSDAPALALRHTAKPGRQEGNHETENQHYDAYGCPLKSIGDLGQYSCSGCCQWSGARVCTYTGNWNSCRTRGERGAAFSLDHWRGVLVTSLAANQAPRSALVRRAGLTILLAKKHPDRKVVGYEASFVPWLVSVFVKKMLGLGNLEIHHKNFLRADLSGADVLVCYLHTDSMSEIARKLAADRSSGGFLISNNFALPFCEPETSMQINDFYKSPIYRYRF